MRTVLWVSLTTAVLAGGCTSGQPPRPQAEPKETVTSADLAAHPNEPIENILQRKVSGAIIMRTPDGGIAVQLRGVSSFNGRVSPPLYIVDDMPFSAGTNGALTGIDPYDIESIRVLKGADAGLYGIDGANGVIVVKTKRGRK